ncbi:Ser-Thr-rich glycosyl-phosphatidyl-inositol-anchored membrane family-domain-containing protein [Terfezia claveryi]|nr:Ser-Thr-rich glycosyl-phosphatidyl-inositol-anchored membrane family-domain-containing protein [Terfezia claveryi]
MRFFTAALLALSTLAATVFAAENKITYPGTGDTIQGGETVVIKWTPSTQDKSITLVLREGKSGNLDVIAPICDNCPNTGSFSWTAPKDLVAGKDYSIEIKYNGGVNFSPQFEIVSTVTVRTTTGTTATATDTTTTTTTTEASTTTATSATSSTVPTTTTLMTSTTSYPNTTVTVSTITSTTSKSKTTGTSSTSTGTGAPNPNSASGSGKTVSGGLIAIVAAAWALTL